MTQFFRDPEAFDALARTVIPCLFDGKGPDDRVRVWVVGCSTGEEVYSLAMLLREEMARLRERESGGMGEWASGGVAADATGEGAGARGAVGEREGAGAAAVSHSPIPPLSHSSAPPRVQIFATDIDGDAVDVARQGRYPESIGEHVSQERLERFFTREKGQYRVRKEVREMCVFSTHNLIQDPPFPELDLISCRNLLIYLDSQIQGKVVGLFHYALRSGGFLFLGAAENIAGRPDLFETVDRSRRIYRRREMSIRAPVELPLAWKAGGAERASAAAPRPPAVLETALHRTLERVLLDEYTPAGMVIREDGDVAYLFGPTGPYLAPSAGAAFNALALVRKSLRADLRNALKEAARTQEPAKRRALPGRTGAGTGAAHIVVRPFTEMGAGLYLVIFQEAPAPAAGAAGPARSPSDDAALDQLHHELRSTREHRTAPAAAGHAPRGGGCRVGGFAPPRGPPAAALRLPASRTADGGRRRGPPAAGGGQPAEQRGEVHAFRRARLGSVGGGGGGGPPPPRQKLVERRAGPPRGEKPPPTPSTIVEIRVRDDGIGISPDLLPHVFDLFTQGKRTPDRAQGGLGLGLTLVRRLVEMHGGSVEARSEGEGKGSEFVVQLPLQGSGFRAQGSGPEAAQPEARGAGSGPGAEPPTASDSAPAPGTGPEPRTLNPEPSPEPSAAKRILLVEDNPDAAEVLAAILEMDGHQVLVAHDGPAALNLAAGYAPDTVLMDIGLPGMNGHEVARRLREHRIAPDAVLIALTGYGADEDVRRSHEAGFAYHLTKPVDPDALKQIVRSA